MEQQKFEKTVPFLDIDTIERRMQDHYNSEEKDEEDSLGNSPTISKEFNIAN